MARNRETNKLKNNLRNYLLPNAAKRKIVTKRVPMQSYPTLIPSI